MATPVDANELMNRINSRDSIPSGTQVNVHVRGCMENNYALANLLQKLFQTTPVTTNLIKEVFRIIYDCFIARVNAFNNPNYSTNPDLIESHINQLEEVIGLAIIINELGYDQLFTNETEVTYYDRRNPSTVKGRKGFWVSVGNITYESTYYYDTSAPEDLKKFVISVNEYANKTANADLPADKAAIKFPEFPPGAVLKPSKSNIQKFIKLFMQEKQSTPNSNIGSSSTISSNTMMQPQPTSTYPSMMQPQPLMRTPLYVIDPESGLRLNIFFNPSTRTYSFTRHDNSIITFIMQNGKAIIRDPKTGLFNIPQPANMHILRNGGNRKRKTKKSKTKKSKKVNHKTLRRRKVRRNVH